MRSLSRLTLLLLACGMNQVLAEEQASTPVKLPVAVDSGPLAGLRKLSDMPLRDTSVCRGPDGTWYLTGTVPPFFGYNEGIKVWKSRDMVRWEPLGMVWRYGASPWHKKYLDVKKPLWAPEIHYLRGTFWLPYSLPGWDGTGRTSGSGLLRSTSGKAEGPYEDVQPGERLGDEIDASLFEDDDHAVYFLWHSGKIARMKDDMSGLAEPYRWLKTTASDPDPRHHSGLCEGIFGKGSFDHVGYEGMSLFKANGRYYLSCAENFEGRYSCTIAMATSLYGPYGPRYEALPHAGHNVFFQDERGQWWSTYFGSDERAPWQERPGVLPVGFDAAGRVGPAADPADPPPADPAAENHPVAALAFHQERPGWFAFDTGLLRGKLRADGHAEGIATLVHVPSGQEVAAAAGGLPGLLSFYRVFSRGNRYGDAARDWPTESKLLADGSVEIRWPPAEDRPVELVAVYRLARPDALDVRVTVTSTRDLRDFEVFLSSYFAKDFDPLVYVRPNRFEQGADRFLPAEVNPLVEGTYLIFPRDERAVPMIFDGRWEIGPNPVQWSITRHLAAPVALRRWGAAGLAAAILSPAEDCFAVAMPYHKTPPDGVAGHGSLYQSLFGRDLAAGRPAAARVRLVVAADLTDEKAVAEYRQWAENGGTQKP